MALEDLEDSRMRRLPLIYDPDIIRDREEARRVRMEYREAARKYLEDLRTGEDKGDKK